MEFFKKNKILSGAFILTFLVFAYYFLIPSGTSKPSVPVATSQTKGFGAASTQPVVSPGAGASAVNSTASTASTATNSDNITILFDKLAHASIDTSIFASPAWVSLIDISSPIPNDPSGKQDLFAPIGQDTVVVTNIKISATTTTTKTTTTKTLNKKKL